MQPLQSHLSGFFSLARGFAAEHLAQHAKASAVTAEDADPVTLVTMPFTAQILIAGADLEVLYRLHFDLQSAEELTKMRVGHATIKLAMDFMREFSNLVSGRIKTALEISGIAMAQGLPFVLKDNEQGANRPFDPTTEAVGSWRLCLPNGISIFNSLFLDLKNPAVLPLLQSVSSEQNQASGEVEVF